MRKNKNRYELSGKKLNPKYFKWIKIFGVSVVLVFSVFLLLFFIFKNDILNWAINKVQHKVYQKYQTTLAIKEYSFTSFSSVKFKQISLKPNFTDTLLSLNEMEASIKIFPLFFGNLRLSALSLNDGQINLIRYDTLTSNFSNFLQKEKSTQEIDLDKKEANFAKSAYKIINKMMAQIPSDFKLNHFNIFYKNSDKIYKFFFDNTSLNEEVLNANIGFSTPTLVQNWIVKGSLSTTDMRSDVKMYAKDHSKMYLPVLDEKYNLILGADLVQLNLEDIDYSSDELKINCFASYTNLVMNHKRLADHDIKVNSGTGEFNFIVGENFFTLDSSSSISVNKIVLHPFVKYQKNPFKLYTLKVSTPDMKAQDFFNSLPDGMFESLNGIQAEGILSYHMFCELNDTCPRDVKFDSELRTNNFKVKSWGAAYLPKINGSFTYTPYEYGKLQRSFELGEANPNYISIEDISPYLKNAVLSSEDPSFYSHKGFVMESIRGSIAQNYISKRFARGASTISMQLVKNVFLSRQKTMTRKFEEMLLVWLIENNHVSSKQRMFEVYLNMIEWGPGIYGIGQASNFYFNKSAFDITLPEAIYLSAIIPRPKGFMWNFNDTTAALKPHMERYIKNLSRIMAGRKLLDESDTAMLNTEIKLTGPAKNLLRKYKNVPDTTEEEIIPADDFEINFQEELELKK
jgi:hypothetical protein